MKNLFVFFIIILAYLGSSKLVFSDEFDTLDLKKWKHDITLAGGGNN